ELRADRLDRVEATLSELALADAARLPAQSPMRYLVSTSWLSYLIQVGRSEECDDHLTNLRAFVGSSVESRQYQLLQNYEADVILLRGVVAEAAGVYERALAVSMRAQSYADVAPSLARGLAECRLQLRGF